MRADGAARPHHPLDQLESFGFIGDYGGKFGEVHGVTLDL
jgi:hypothetical protein